MNKAQKQNAPDWAIEQAMILACIISDEMLSDWQIDTLAIKLASGEIRFEDYTK